MKTRWVWSGLTASAVMMATGLAFSGGTTTSDAQLMDFNQATGELWAYPDGQALSTYLHEPRTRHVLADLARFAPPDPCRPLAEAWNFTVRYDQRFGVRSTFVFDVLLVTMAEFQCRATVTSVAGQPQPIVIITPTAN
ncbi:MAG TPA: hypothetical protein VIF15_06580 [Polyangiaceae bacterium]|jgi:hypothetical protein